MIIGGRVVITHWDVSSEIEFDRSAWSGNLAPTTSGYFYDGSTAILRSAVTNHEMRQILECRGIGDRRDTFNLIHFAKTSLTSVGLKKVGAYYKNASETVQLVIGLAEEKPIAVSAANWRLAVGAIGGQLDLMTACQPVRDRFALVMWKSGEVVAIVHAYNLEGRALARVRRELEVAR